MNVYDFDETIFEGDSEVRFFNYLGTLPQYKSVKAKFRFIEFFSKKLGWIDRTVARQWQYSFLKKVDDIDSLLEDYWNQAEKYVKKWYLEVKQPDDIIASGTPEFLMLPILKRLGLKDIVATDMDKKTGKITGHFAIEQYKLEYFKAKNYDASKIDKFYSDAYSDHFLADIAKEAWFIHGENFDQFSEWKEYFTTHEKKNERR